MPYKLYTFAFSLLFSLCAMSQVKWMDFNNLPIEFKASKKPLLLFIHTDWCKICKMQEGTVFADDSISKQLNEQFNTLKLNAEDVNDISFFGRTYQGATSNSYHEFAEYIGKEGNVLNFPTLLILNERLEIVYKKAGFVSKEELLIQISCVK
ncbi:thioredoxin family protein [Vicingaceae bacterium]|nr:thioredoxin family protein [Vicingaceae bacterium]